MSKRHNSRSPRALLTYAAIVTVVTLFSIFSRAEVVYLTAKPTSKISVSEARKNGGYKCVSVRVSDSGNYVKGKKAKATWHKTAGKSISIAEVDALIEAKKKAYKCELMVRDAETGKMGRAETEESEE